MKKINNYIIEKLKLNKDSEMENQDDLTVLSEVISVITAKDIKPTIAVCLASSRYPDLINIDYPLVIGENEITCGGAGTNIKNNNVKIRPATAKEIKMWRNADGVGKSNRKTANTVDKIKAIKWVDVGLRNGEKIITSLDQI